MTDAIALSPERARDWLELALQEARAGLAEGGQAIGAVLVGPTGEVLGRGRNRFVQSGDVAAHAETEAFSDAGHQETYRGATMVTTAEPCWYCSGLIRQFGISRVVVGVATGLGGSEWLEDLGHEVVVVGNPEAAELLESARGLMWAAERALYRD